MHFMLGCFCYFFKKEEEEEEEEEEGKGKKNVFCIIFLGLKVKVDHIIFI